MNVLNRAFGSLILHEITAHRIEQFKRERLAGKWRGHKSTSAPRPIRPATVNRELEDCQDGYVTFWETKNGRPRRIPISPAIEAVLAAQPRVHPRVFTNARGKTPKPYTVNGVAHVFNRAVTCASITSGDVTLHTLRHTALSRMIAAGYDDHTVMDLSGHSSTRMLGRSKQVGKEGGRAVHLRCFAATVDNLRVRDGLPTEAPSRFRGAKVGGRQEARTPDLRVANAALSQLS